MRQIVIMIFMMHLFTECYAQKYISQIPFKYDYSLELLKKQSQMKETGLKNKTVVNDNSENLSDEVLEEIRLLTNLETSTEKLLQIILVGQPELSSRLNSPKLRQLKQRISLRCSLEPLTLSETAQYIRTRLQIAGLPEQEIFSDSCIAAIHRCWGNSTSGQYHL